MATYYVKVVDGVLKYRSGAIPDAANGTIATSVHQMFFDIGNGHTAVFTSGTYPKTILKTTAGSVSLGRTVAIRSMTPFDPGYDTDGGHVIWDFAGMGAAGFSFGVAGSMTGPDFILQNSDSGYAATTTTGGGASFTFDKVTFKNNGQNWNDGGNAAICVFKDCLFKGSLSHSIVMNNLSSEVSVVNTIATENLSSLALVYKGTFSFRRSIALNNKNGVVLSGANSQVVNVEASIVGVTDLATAPTIDKGDSNNSIINISKSLILQQPMQRSTPAVTAGVALTDCVEGQTPGFKNPRRPGMMSVVIDDAYSASNALIVATLAEQYGFRVTWVVDVENMATADWEIADTLHANGHEIGSHSMTHANLATACTASPDAEACVYEIAGSRAALVARGYNPRTLIFPGGAYNENVKTAAANAGYLVAGGTVAGTYLMESITRFHVRRDGPGSFLGMKSESPTEAQIRTRAAALCEWLNVCGGWITFNLHDNDVNGGDSDMTPENLAFLFDVVSKSNVMFKTFGDAMQYVIDNAVTTTGSGGAIAYNRTFTDQSDYHLLPTSPCIGAGIDVGLTTDLDGNAVPGAVGYDIGPYSYMPGWTLFDESMPALSLSPDLLGHGKLRQVQEWKKVATAREIGKY